MTPEEKAQELVDKFGDTETDITFVNSDSDTELASGYLTRNAAKQCALIAVEELINCTQFAGDLDQVFAYNEETKEFWFDVKNEINAL